MNSIFFNDWQSLLRILVIGVLGYIGLVFILRISGTRTLSKMNSFDFIVTIALGSTFASALLQKDLTLSDALFAMFVLVGLQFVVTWISVRFSFFNKFIKAEPILLFFDGVFLEQAMKRAHVTKDEVLAGVRQQGMSDIDEVQFVILESNGRIVATKKEKE